VQNLNYPNVIIELSSIKTAQFSLLLSSAPIITFQHNLSRGLSENIFKHSVRYRSIIIIQFMVAQCMFKALAVMKSLINLYYPAITTEQKQLQMYIHQSITLSKVIAQRSKFLKHKITRRIVYTKPPIKILKYKKIEYID